MSNFFSIPFLFGLTVPQQVIAFVCKSSNDAGDEKKLSMYNLCPTCSILAVYPLTVVCVPVTERVARFLSLPKYHSQIINISLRTTQLVQLYSKPLVFFWYILLDDASTSEEHNDFINC
jgi:hypothetical protein